MRCGGSVGDVVAQRTCGYIMEIWWLWDVVAMRCGGSVWDVVAHWRFGGSIEPAEAVVPGSLCISPYKKGLPGSLCNSVKSQGVLRGKPNQQHIFYIFLCKSQPYILLGSFKLSRWPWNQLKRQLGIFFKFSTVFPLACRIAWIKAVYATPGLYKAGWFEEKNNLGDLDLNFSN